VAPDDVDALTTTLGKALTGAVDLAALGRAAAGKAEQSLDIGAIGAAYARVLDDVSERRTARA
jgi:hypothetical protein